MMQEHLRRMARYNAWANRRLYAACEQLAEDEYHRPRAAFFGSIHGTLNHLLVGDRIWLARIAATPSPKVRLDDRPCASLAELKEARAAEDGRVIELVDGDAEADLQRPVRYRRVTAPDDVVTPLHVCWLHLFNHQTHHRGQAHATLTALRQPSLTLDLVFFLRTEGKKWAD